MVAFCFFFTVNAVVSRTRGFPRTLQHTNTCERARHVLEPTGSPVYQLQLQDGQTTSFRRVAITDHMGGRGRSNKQI